MGSPYDWPGTALGGLVMLRVLSGWGAPHRIVEAACGLSPSSSRMCSKISAKHSISLSSTTLWPRSSFVAFECGCGPRQQGQLRRVLADSPRDVPLNIAKPIFGTNNHGPVGEDESFANSRRTMLARSFPAQGAHVATIVATATPASSPLILSTRSLIFTLIPVSAFARAMSGSRHDAHHTVCVMP